MEVREPVAKYLARPAFKQTEMGLIPEDWDIKPIAQIAPFQRGFDLPNRELKPGPIPVVYSNGVENFHSVAMVKGPGVVTGRSGTIGKLQYLDTDFWPHNTTLWVTGFNGNVPKFIYYLYCSLEFERFASGSGVPTLNRNDAHSYKLPLPRNTKEQEVIAEALTDADALIEALEQLLAKKRQIKQGAMQELLTGRKRLPGFVKKWEVKRLGEICDISMGRTPSRLVSSYWGSGYKWLSIADLKSKVVSESKEEITPLATSEMRVIRKGTLLMSFKLSIGRLCFAGCDLYTNEAICSFNNLEANAEFLYYILGRTDFSLYGKQAVKGYTLNSESLKLIEVPLPTIEEQTAIAAVLSDMDAEIDAIEAKLAKARQVKQGMMQELLTGRIRLV